MSLTTNSLVKLLSFLYKSIVYDFNYKLSDFPLHIICTDNSSPHILENLNTLDQWPNMNLREGFSHCLFQLYWVQLLWVDMCSKNLRLCSFVKLISIKFFHFFCELSIWFTCWLRVLSPTFCFVPRLTWIDKCA